MMDLVNGFMADMKMGPVWVYYWVMFMGFVFMFSIPFSFIRKEARWVFICTLLLAPILMIILYSRFGYERILGLGLIVAWPPALWYLWRTRKTWKVSETITGKWIALTFAVMLISLAFDITDVVRYALSI